MTITYSCIANGRAVLAELALTGGSYQEAAATVLRLVLLRAEPKTIMRMGSFVYHTLFIDGITYLCATDNALDTITPSAFLKNMKYNKNQGDSSISTLRSQVTDVKNIMSKNIDEILETEERLNVFTDRNDDLQTTAKESQKTRKILRRVWWKHFRKIIVITVSSTINNYESILPWQEDWREKGLEVFACPVSVLYGLLYLFHFCNAARFSPLLQLLPQPLFPLKLKAQTLESDH
ncbi:vesicle-associated membrane protein 7-like isoform X2 [Hyaena hyaena]|uniref:vesicle-associated membrane protein 7-like isoform X2 n=1 Tax=Hyaena hyaena TaxID=95912 RepID=UPI001920C591|nr:vesicle-associated membrane protein 7-like isoform X2 [Hyaena hyaena]